MPPTTFDVVDRTDGSVLGSFPVVGEAGVRAAVARAREAAAPWAAASPGARARALRTWRGELWRSAVDLAGLLQREAGLDLDEAMVEVLRSVEHLRWAERAAPSVLASRGVGAGRLSPELGRTESWVPEGVVAVVTAGRPSLYAAASATTCALLAGNPVVLQPGGRLTAVLSAWVDALGRAQPDAPGGLLQAVTGDDTTAVALAGSAVDRLCYLGSPVAGVRVSTAAARAMVPATVVPVVAPVTLVAPDADLAAAAAAVAGLGRGDDGPPPEVYVAPSVLDAFRSELDRAGAPAPRRGLPRALGRRRGGSDPLALPGPRVDVRVETAPTFEVLVERLRAHPGAEVAVHSARHGAHLAGLLGASEVSVNLPAAAQAAAEGGLPRAALGARGWGPFAGEQGLRTFARARTTTARRRLPLPLLPVEVALASPPGRVATRLALHVRHSLD
ncbi:aldehyde dehydrogenase family protein [Nocardioides litoris]|uniref:aldehyde dehydrogenase family protein n=1 Tax=Nocardioides litoris TaxID=1926648 RepID=UPI001477639B|nr:aldehyde dehydrogenase family protein [Nocardioides litoris]